MVHELDAIADASGTTASGTSPNDALLLPANRKSTNSPVRVQIVPSQPKTLSHLPKRPALDLAFHDLTYSVREGRRSSEYPKLFFCCLIIVVCIGIWPGLRNARGDRACVCATR